MKVSLEVTTRKTKRTVMTCHQNVGQNHSLLVANKCFQNVGRFKYFGTTVANENFIHEEIRGD
jgi:hypothetical protein